MRAQAIIQEQLVTLGDHSLFDFIMNESAELSFLASFLLTVKLLTRIRFVLIRMIQALESCMREFAGFLTSRTRFLIIVLALLCSVVNFVRRPPEIKRLMCIDTMVPIVIFGLVCAKSSFVSVHIEHNGIYCF